MDNDFSLNSLHPVLKTPGDTKIWYFKNKCAEIMTPICIASDFDTVPVCSTNLAETHVQVITTNETNLWEVFRQMQGEVYCCSETFPIFNKLKTHSSLSMGDIVEIGNDVFVLAFFGWKKLKGSTLLPLDGDDEAVVQKKRKVEEIEKSNHENDTTSSIPTRKKKAKQTMSTPTPTSTTTIDSNNKNITINKSKHV